MSEMLGQPTPDKVTYTQIPLVTEVPPTPEAKGSGPEARLLETMAWADEVKAQRQPNPDQKANSFDDVYGNLMSVARPCVRYLKQGYSEPGYDPQAQLKECLTLLDRYARVITSTPGALQAELTTIDGAFPGLRQEADRLKAAGQEQRPIAYYIAHMPDPAPEVSQVW